MNNTRGAVKIWEQPVIHNNAFFANADGGNGQSKETNCKALMSLLVKLRDAYNAPTPKSVAEKNKLKADMAAILSQLKLEGCNIDSGGGYHGVNGAVQGGAAHAHPTNAVCNNLLANVNNLKAIFLAISPQTYSNPAAVTAVNNLNNAITAYNASGCIGNDVMGHYVLSVSTVSTGGGSIPFTSQYAMADGGCGCGGNCKGCSGDCKNCKKCNCGSASFTGDSPDATPINPVYAWTSGAFTANQSPTNAFTIPTINAFANPANQMPAVVNLPTPNVYVPDGGANGYGAIASTTPAPVPMDSAFANTLPATPSGAFTAPTTADVVATPAVVTTPIPAPKRNFIQWLFNGMK